MSKKIIVVKRPLKWIIDWFEIWRTTMLEKIFNLKIWYLSYNKIFLSFSNIKIEVFFEAKNFYLYIENND